MIPPVDVEARARAKERQGQLTKPAGSLGRLEEVSVQLAGITGRVRPSVERKAIVVMAADHGVVEEGVSSYPWEVTRQMALNFLRGGAAINVLARQAGARLTIVNAGIRGPSLGVTGWNGVRLVDRPVAPGTGNMARGPALTASQVEEAVALGRETVREEAGAGLDLLGVGEMGIGNTTASAAIVSALSGRPPVETAGRGAGLDDEGFRRKVAVIERALEVNRPDPRDPLDVLRKVGGLEIAGLAGAMIEAASARVPVALDGFITGAAALLAELIAPGVRQYFIASHRSQEPGHGIVLDRLGLKPLLCLELRLGEGSGAALAFHLIEAAARTLDGMATFAEAGVSGKRT